MILIWSTITAALLLLFITVRVGSRVSGQHGGPINPPAKAAESQTRLRIATLNMQYGRGQDQRLDLPRTASAINDCDFVALQEVAGAKQINQPNQAAVLGEILDMKWLFAPTKTRWFRPFAGNAVLTSVPIRRWFWRPLVHVRGRSFRNMVVCELMLAGKKVTIINTHLHTKMGREEQMQQVFREFAKYRRAILLGDFNTQAQDPLLLDLIRKSAAHNPFVDASGSISSNARVDWIILKGVTATEVAVSEPGASDHPTVRATVTLESV